MGSAGRALPFWRLRKLIHRDCVHDIIVGPTHDQMVRFLESLGGFGKRRPGLGQVPVAGGALIEYAGNSILVSSINQLL